ARHFRGACGAQEASSPRADDLPVGRRLARLDRKPRRACARQAGPGAMSTSGLAHASFTTEDGAEISYRVRRGHDPIVLIHGLGCDASMWDGVVAALPSDVGLVIPELRGHGASTLGWRAPSVDQWADDVVRLL